MNNPILLNTLYWEWESEMWEKCLHIDDIEAIKRVHKLLERELPKEEVIRDELDTM